MRRVKVGLLILALVLSALPGASPAIAAGSYTCTGGAVPPGTYQSLTIAGDCTITAGAVVVLDDLVLKPGSSLNAALPPGGTLTVHGDVVVWKDAIFVLGCAPSICPTKVTNDRIYGNLRSYGALALILHGNYIGGHVSVRGGGGGAGSFPNAHMAQVIGFPIAYSTFEGNTIRGGASISGLDGYWFGFLRNEVRGTVSIMNNKFIDPDATEIVMNQVKGSLMCSGNSPGAQVGDASEGSGLPVEAFYNTVTGQAKGECSGLVK